MEEEEKGKEFKVSDSISRGELAKWIVKGLNIPLQIVRAPLAKDVPKNHPLAVYIKIVLDNKIMENIDDYFL